MNRSTIIAAAALLAIGVGALWWTGQDAGSPGENAGIVLPKLTSAQAAGKTLFDANCSACHGRNAIGSDQGPPLVHIIYEPDHHGDASFYRAAAMGVRAHHWRFGNMPAIEGVSETDVGAIIEYVRALQRANGIE